MIKEIMTLKDAIRLFFNNLLTVPPTVSSTYAQVARAQIVRRSRETHQAPITCNVWYVNPLCVCSWNT